MKKSYIVHCIRRRHIIGMLLFETNIVFNCDINKINIMFNRHIYERYELALSVQLKKEQEYALFMDHRKKNRTQRTEHYKARVRDFLVKMASRPMQLGQYIPPVKDIMRDNDQTKNLASPQMFINGFKTNKQRLQRTVSDNKIIDYTPTPSNALNHEYRSRLMNKQIQPGMRFQGNASPKNANITSSRSSLKLPNISRVQVNPEVKMHFKGIEEMGNKLKSMEQRESDRIGLINKLQTVYGGGDINLQQTSLDVLKSCKLNKSKTVKTLRSTSLPRTLASQQSH